MGEEFAHVSAASFHLNAIAAPTPPVFRIYNAVVDLLQSHGCEGEEIVATWRQS